MSSLDEESLERVVDLVQDLPSLPGVVEEVARLTLDPGVTILQINHCIQKDPGLSAKILKVSNSSYYGMRQTVGSLKLALVVLGIREVRNIVLGISIFETLNDHRMDDGFWRHSLLVAAFSKKIGGTLALGLQGEDFIAGLLHDVGKLVLMRACGNTYERLYAGAGGGGEALCELENDAYGFDHCDTAAALALRWNLPRLLVDALWCHHVNPQRPLTAAKDEKLAAVVRIANMAAHEDFTADAPAQSAACAHEEAWGLLKSPRAPASLEERYAFLKESITDVMASPDLSLL